MVLAIVKVSSEISVTEHKSVVLLTESPVSIGGGGGAQICIDV